MRQFARPRFGASRVLHSRARVPHGGHATSRVALVVVALGVACLGLTSTGAVAASTTTTSSTLPRTTVLAGNAYTRHFLDAQPIPPEARRVTTLPTPLPANGDVGDSPYVRADHHLYLLPMSVSVDAYVRAHLLKGEKVTETGSGFSPHAYPTYNMGVSVTCVSPHITFCGIYYQTTEAKNGEQELRVDAQVIYLPILHVKMPTDGVVTVTGYGLASAMNGSSDPTSVVLSRHQALTLHTVISRMQNLGSIGGCMESSLLLKISIVKHGNVIWSATADDCPGELAITSATSSPILDARWCPFWHVVGTFFPSGVATATKGDNDCADSQYS
jgi:hypothetical protein